MFPWTAKLCVTWYSRLHFTNILNFEMKVKFPKDVNFNTVSYHSSQSVVAIPADKIFSLEKNLKEI